MTKLNTKQKNLIIGTLLGDGNLQTFSNGRTWRYRALHAAKDEAYLMHKYSLIKDLCQTSPIYGEAVDAKRDKTYKRFYFNTVVDDCFRFYANLFYKNVEGHFIKVIPKNIAKWLNPEVLAYLYMDDGSLKWRGKSNAMRICTEGFSYLCIKRLQKAISRKFNLDLTLTKVRKNKIIVGYRLFISEANSDRFRELVLPYMVDSMKYKLSDGDRYHL